MTLGLICLGLVLVLAFLRVPLAFSLLTVSFFGIAWDYGYSTSITMLSMTISDAVFSYDLAVVPLFILMGNILSKTGIAADLFRAANAYLGHIRGGLALSTMVTCAGFSAVCGSSLATAATMSKVAYPSMKKYGYSDSLASASIAAGGTLGILIPPSIILMIYGILTQTNIGELFIAGVVPGLLGLAFYMIAIYVVALFKPEHAPRGDRSDAKEKVESLKGVWPFFMLFILIFGGIYAKLFTATEAAGMGAGFALIIAVWQKRMTWAKLKNIFLDASFTSVMLYSVLFGAMLFAKFVSFSGLAEGILSAVEASGLSNYELIALIMIIFLLLGCVMDSLAIILICVPLFVPIVLANGFDLIWFGIIVVVVTEIALITPPIGMNVFVLKATLPNVSFASIFKGLVPFIGVDLLRLILLIAVPSLSLGLVEMMR
ncbi:MULTISPECIES: TRAP transporter large permease [unclassified Marinobacterium]|uniref:TRAP transporter large permease n=1 Tax=unclassified Marinobacterium TaxID=2644139 RepID=UPI001567F533|nr:MULTISPECIES: TRAP transporter large permease [unclassified Marinobacterium]NRP15333.1 Sialic acid TRAP transporter permease protein SiaT [Marinobacterium sp. xm-a-152]NRP26600.1 Sialic acid TRAP transporter permease protein SiaT [Marinobacterium sp. xm-d-420]NRP56569.1 Sialic acid TRAP transporter permease protein SiaT [Marinobacterium sp. xm-d-510]NRP96642.1 Sialic acid TRAP transporter permease protein SiaT [Marinobacterium sp. xm-a-127]